MKTFQQFNEDIEQRRKQLQQRSLDKMAAYKKNVANYKSAQKEKEEAAQERESLKKEIKRELQTEQTPHMKPSEYNKQISQQSARWKGQQIRQSHDEMEREAYAQLSAKRQRLKTIMKR